MLDWLSGKKTYILTALAVLTAAANLYFNDGALSLEELRELLAILFGGGAVMAHRAGVQKAQDAAEGR